MSLRLAYSSWILPWSCCEEVVGYDKEEMESGDVGIYLPAAKEHMVTGRSDGGAPHWVLGPQVLPLHIPAQM